MRRSTNKFARFALSTSVVRTGPKRFYSARDGDTTPHTYTQTASVSNGPRYCWSGLSYWYLTVHITNGPSDGIADSSRVRVRVRVRVRGGDSRPVNQTQNVSTRAVTVHVGCDA